MPPSREASSWSTSAACRTARSAARLESGLSLVDARSGSLPESLLRVALVDAGLPVEPQAHVPGVGRVDFLVDGVIVEVDGFAYHSGRDQYREDRRRDRAAHRLGYVVLRYTFEEVVHDGRGWWRRSRASAASIGGGPRGERRVTAARASGSWTARARTDLAAWAAARASAALGSAGRAGRAVGGGQRSDAH